MRNLRHTVSLTAVVLLTGTAMACAPDRSPTAPSLGASDVGAVRTSVSGAAATKTWSVVGLRRAHPLRTDLTVTRVIGPRGGRLDHEAAGFTLEVPAGAVATPTTFRVTALAGEMVAYDFGPDGSVFPKALRATQDLRNTSAPRLPRNVSFTLGQIGADGKLLAAPTQEVTGTVDRTGRSVSFGIPHFSGWIVMWRDGRGGDSTEVP
ncbi:MAG: hypothetical protein ACXWZS_03395 [Gemmatirosa sp.]